uniref:GST N-terminal domain-containing protein n=2 Tax=Guillardia theta TaxID=55529 RepID=A0A7S4PB60_GUITH
MVRSFLAYAGIAHQSILVSMPGKKEIKWSKYKKVPIVTVNGLQINDSYIIFKELSRIIFGRQLSESESRQVHEVTYGLLLAYEAEIFGNEESRSRFIATFLKGNCCFTCFIVPLIRHMLSKAPAKIKKSNPGLKSLDEYGKKIRSEMAGTFIGGSQPGPVDVMVWGLVEQARHIEVKTMESWLSRTDLMPWFKNMDGIMSSKKSIW